MSTDRPTIRRAVSAIATRDSRLLVIRRSAHVVAPGMYCFPGGGIEPGETEQDAVRREMQEELGLRVQPSERIWENVTPWQVAVAWWTVDLLDERPPTPNPAEVADVQWVTLTELAALRPLLSSNRDFLAAWERGEIVQRW